MRVDFIMNGRVSSNELNALWHNAWPDHVDRDLIGPLKSCESYVLAREGAKLLGFAKVITDGDLHAVLLDVITHTSARRQGIGRRMVEMLVGDVKAKGCSNMHVDFEPHNSDFYEALGFSNTAAGLLRI